MAKSGDGGGFGFGQRGAAATLYGGNWNLGFTLLKCQSGRLEEHTGRKNKKKKSAFTDFQQIFFF